MASNIEAMNRYKKKWPERYKTSKRKARLKQLYGISLEYYNNLFEEQQGCCGICGKHQTELSITLHVDHDHKTNEIRGLLCADCNLGLGKLGDSLEGLQRAMEYLS